MRIGPRLRKPSLYAVVVISTLSIAYVASGYVIERQIKQLNHRVLQIATQHTRDRLIPFRSDAEFNAFTSELARVIELRERSRAQQRARSAGVLFEARSDEPADQSAPASPADESITNTQEAGVDEGSIVKAYRDYLVVLRRGRLFSMKLESGDLRAISAIDTPAPGASTGGWYDEMLLHDGTIVVVGYSYEHRATELGIFNIDTQGQLSHRETFFLSSADYYSSRNYASRLVGSTLLFYMPYPLISSRGGLNFEPQLPRMRSHGDADWSTIVDTTEVYRPVQVVDYPVMHTVVSCDLAQANLSCQARGVLGPHSRNFYVSRDAVWLWVSGGLDDGWEEDASAHDAVAYRLPLDGSAPGALQVSGTPVDQFSFRESPDGHLNVLLRGGGFGDGMWGPEESHGRVSFFRAPLRAFSRAVGASTSEQYAALPSPEGYTFQNRFVGDHLLYGSGSGWYNDDDTRNHALYIYPYSEGRNAEVSHLELEHGVDRIEVMGGSSVVIGSADRSLHFSAIGLRGEPRVTGEYVQPGAAQGELRSHGFFYKAQPDGSGILGLPIRSAGSPGYSHLRRGSASVLFLRVENEEEFAELGSLRARPGRFNDRCRVSCVDWYGNARPIFYRGRTFALLGYELVEGEIRSDSLRELRRGNFLRAL